jgi:carbon storage regulator CsrA
MDESICIGQDIVVKVVRIRGNVVGLGIVAPKNVKVMRNELLERDRLKSMLEVPCSPVQDSARIEPSSLGSITVAG